MAKHLLAMRDAPKAFSLPAAPLPAAAEPHSLPAALLPAPLAAPTVAPPLQASLTPAHYREELAIADALQNLVDPRRNSRASPEQVLAVQTAQVRPRQRPRAGSARV
jgi:hypothetical protein